MSKNERRKFLEKMALASGAVLLGGCDRLAENESFKSLLATADAPTDFALHALTPENALASEFTEADLSLRLNDFHADCLTALQAGDGLAARAAIEQDLQYFGNFLLNLLSLTPAKCSKH